MLWNLLSRAVGMKQISSQTLMLSLTAFLFGSVIVVSAAEFVVFSHQIEQVRSELASVRQTLSDQQVTTTIMQVDLQHGIDTLDRRTPFITSMTGSLSDIEMKMGRVEGRLGIPSTQATTKPSE